MAAALLSPINGIPGKKGHMTGHMTFRMAGGSEGAVNKGVDDDISKEKLAPPEIQISKM